MVETRACEFCGDDIEPGTGLMLVANDGSRHHFCSSKCESNAELGRSPRDVEWAGGEAGEAEQAETEVEADTAIAGEEGAEEAAAETEEPEAAEQETDAEPEGLLMALAACHPAPAGGTWIDPEQT